MLPDLTSLQWLVAAMLALQWAGALAAISIIGKPRKPMTPGIAVTTLLIVIGWTVWALMAA